MSLDARWIRLRVVWLLVIPFLWFARPTPVLLAWGGALAAVGLAVRSWAAGVIRKGRELTTEGPYAFTRNPLYVGSLLVGVGVTVAGGHVLFVVAFLLFFVLVYGRTIGEEARLLEELFGAEYRRYARHVPLVVPRLTPWRPARTAAADASAGRPPDAGDPSPGDYAHVAADARARADASREPAVRFSFRRWRRNREYEALAGAAAGFAFLAAKMLWM